VVELAERKFLVHHIVNPHSLEDSIRGRIAREQPAVVVFGHTHKAFCQTLGPTLFFNPGYAGKSRFGMERSVAILHCDEAEIRPEYLRL
jgi:predicted phosphodiesterase